MDLKDIDNLAAKHRADRDALGETMSELNQAIELLKRDYRRKIARRVHRSQASLEALTQAVADHPELFDKPKTRTLHGFKVGYQLKRGTTVIDDATRTKELIRRYFNDREDELIRIEERIDATALNRLEPKEMARIGVRIEGAGDVVIVRPTDSDLDKLLKDLLPTEAQLAEEQEEAA